MKNKALTYVLGIAVLAVWGIVIYRIFVAVKGDDDSTSAIVASPVKEAYNDYAIPKDTTRLLLNYRDPFGLVKPRDTVKIIRGDAKKTIAAAKPAMNWGFIKYTGYIRNPGSKRFITILTINGKNVMLAEGETSDNVKLIKNMRDSIKISFNGKTKFITMNSGSI